MNIAINGSATRLKGGTVCAVSRGSYLTAPGSQVQA